MPKLKEYLSAENNFCRVATSSYRDTAKGDALESERAPD